MLSKVKREIKKLVLNYFVIILIMIQTKQERYELIVWNLIILSMNIAIKIIVKLFKR